MYTGLFYFSCYILPRFVYCIVSDQVKGGFMAEKFVITESELQKIFSQSFMGGWKLNRDTGEPLTLERASAQWNKLAKKAEQAQEAGLEVTFENDNQRQSIKFTRHINL
jgi:hypothetical protein